jgi:hypothetical protein
MITRSSFSKLETLEKLTNENFLLHQLIAYYQENWGRTLGLLQKAQEALISLRSTLEKCVQEERVAERDWLAFWGISGEVR